MRANVCVCRRECMHAVVCVCACKHVYVYVCTYMYVLCTSVGVHECVGTGVYTRVS